MDRNYPSNIRHLAKMAGETMLFDAIGADANYNDPFVNYLDFREVAGMSSLIPGDNLASDALNSIVDAAIGYATPHAIPMDPAAPDDIWRLIHQITGLSRTLRAEQRVPFPSGSYVEPFVFRMDAIGEAGPRFYHNDIVVTVDSALGYRRDSVGFPVDGPGTAFNEVVEKSRTIAPKEVQMLGARVVEANHSTVLGRIREYIGIPDSLYVAKAAEARFFNRSRLIDDKTISGFNFYTNNFATTIFNDDTLVTPPVP